MKWVTVLGFTSSSEPVTSKCVTYEQIRTVQLYISLPPNCINL